MICENISFENGLLRFAGRNPLELAAKYGTPLYLYDEDRVRANMRRFRNAVKTHFGEGSEVLYASKAASFKQIYRIAAEEGIWTDVVSSGEIATAQAAGFDLSHSCFHSNNKTPEDISYAMDRGVGYFAVDCPEELYALAAESAARGITQKIILRITPGIDPHTYEAVATGRVDSKFGSAIETGQAENITALALSLGNLKLCGYHCHVGSQLFDSEVQLRTAEIMMNFVADMKDKFGFEAQVLDLGGGFGVRYTEEQPAPDAASVIADVAKLLKSTAAARGVKMPDIFIEPGRAIVADAALMLYTVGSVKRIPGYKQYVSVDGGMTDNPRYALYKSPYTFYDASRPVSEKTERFTVAGRCCESGDLLGENIPLPADICRGDILACCTAGAYQFAMSSGYNRVPRPGLVMLKGGEDYVAVRRQTPEDMAEFDI
ncbi:MAG: diaminopimelate decarboxylase [Clostridia bacterium]|nr:diaminopimelate decarboxylase [Clostridia bacterium]